jgi:hypothetical protein
LLRQYEARKKPARAAVVDQSATQVIDSRGKPVQVVKSLRQRHQEKEKAQYRTPWGWPGAEKESAQQPHISDTVRTFTDRLVRQKQLVQSDRTAASGSIRALLEDRYGPVDRGMAEIPYHKVKRPLLRDPAEMHDQLDNLGSAEARQLRKKLQFLSAMNNEQQAGGQSDGLKKSRKVEFRYVELKDLKQPWGW